MVLVTFGCVLVEGWGGGEEQVSAAASEGSALLPGSWARAP